MQSIEAESNVAGGIEPLGDAVDRRGCAAVDEGCRTLAAARVLPGGEVAFRRVQHVLAACGLLQGRGVVRDEALQHLRKIERECNGESNHHRARHDADCPLVHPERAHPLRNAATRQREHEQWEGSADRERRREQDGFDPDLPGGPSNGDRGEHRTSAGNVDSAEGEPEYEAAAVGGDRALRDPGEGLLEQVLHLRHDEPDADDDEHHEAGPAESILREMQE